MGFFGKLFEKKECAICGGEIGLLGNRKLEDGNMCKNCASKLSPFFSERRSSTVAQIQEQLQYREKNREAVAAFQVTRTFGERTKIYVDENQGKFMVTSARDYREANPDVIDCSAVTDVREDVREDQREEKTKDKEGKSVSYVPPRYKYYVEYSVTISVNHPYFDSIKVELTDSDIELNHVATIAVRKPDMRSNPKVLNCERDVQDIRNLLLNRRQRLDDARTAQVIDAIREDAAKMRAQGAAGAAAGAAAAAAPQTVTCPWCGSQTVNDGSGHCGVCGGDL